jgi:arylsulfatase A-like enzyme
MYGETDHLRPYIFTAYRDCQRMVRNDRWKLIEYFVNGQRHTQLFDLSTDPDEINDLSNRDQSAEVLARLRSELQRLGASFHDPDVALYSNTSASSAGK